MPDASQTENNKGETAKAFKQNDSLGLWLIVTIGFALIVGLIIASIYIPNLTERVKFATVNLLSLLVFIVIAIQTYIYRKQWIAMQQHLEVMKDTLAETRRIFDLTERPVIIAVSATIPRITPNLPLRPIVKFANKGRTMAEEFNVTIEIAAKKGYMYAGFENTGAVPSGSFLLPANDEISIEAAPADAVTLDGEFYDSAKQGHEFFMVHGKGNYKDLAGREYQIRYAFWFHPDRGFIPHPYPKPLPKQSEN